MIWRLKAKLRPRQASTGKPVKFGERCDSPLSGPAKKCTVQITLLWLAYARLSWSGTPGTSFCIRWCSNISPSPPPKKNNNSPLLDLDNGLWKFEYLQLFHIGLPHWLSNVNTADYCILPKLIILVDFRHSFTGTVKPAMTLQQRQHIKTFEFWCQVVEYSIIRFRPAAEVC